MWFFGKRNKKLGNKLKETSQNNLDKKLDEWRNEAKTSAQVLFDVIKEDFVKQSNEGHFSMSYSFKEFANIMFDNDILTPNFVFDELKKICKRNKIHAYTIKEENDLDIAYYCFKW